MCTSCPADDSKELARVGPGQCFGEMALLSGDTRAANIMALDNSEVRLTGLPYHSRLCSLLRNAGQARMAR